MTTPDKRASRPTIARSLGQFFGQIARAVREPVDPEQRTEIGRTSESVEARDASGKQVILRRTTIDEIVERPDTQQHNGEDPR